MSAVAEAVEIGKTQRGRDAVIVRGRSRMVVVTAWADRWHVRLFPLADYVPESEHVLASATVSTPNIEAQVRAMLRFKGRGRT